MPLPGRDRLRAAAARRVGGHHDEPRQVLALAAQPVGDPRPHARTTLDRRAGVHHGVRGVVVDLVGVHRPDDAEVVGVAGGLRQEVADLLSPDWPCFWNFASGRRTFSSCPCNCAIGWPLVNDPGIGLPSSAASSGLVVERLELRRPPRHVQEDDTLHLRAVVQGADHPAGGPGIAPRLGGEGREVAVQERGEGDRAEPDRGAAEEGPAVRGGVRVRRSGRIGSLPRDRLVEVQDRAGHRGPGGEFRGIEGGVGGSLTDPQQSSGRCRGRR